MRNRLLCDRCWQQRCHRIGRSCASRKICTWTDSFNHIIHYLEKAAVIKLLLFSFCTWQIHKSTYNVIIGGILCIAVNAEISFRTEVYFVIYAEQDRPSLHQFMQSLNQYAATAAEKLSRPEAHHVTIAELLSLKYSHSLNTDKYRHGWKKLRKLMKCRSHTIQIAGYY